MAPTMPTAEQPTSSTKQPVGDLMAALSPEIRLMIYEELFASSTPQPQTKTSSGSLDSYGYYFPRPAILKVSQLVREEAMKPYYEALKKTSAEKIEEHLNLAKALGMDVTTCPRIWNLKAFCALAGGVLKHLAEEMVKFDDALATESVLLLEQGFRHLVYKKWKGVGGEEYYSVPEA